jgi:hypothetical protein
MFISFKRWTREATGALTSSDYPATVNGDEEEGFHIANSSGFTLLLTSGQIRNWPLKIQQSNH